jgi:hypothetical protein
MILNEIVTTRNIIVIRKIRHITRRNNVMQHIDYIVYIIRLSHWIVYEILRMTINVYTLRPIMYLCCDNSDVPIDT